MNPYLKTAVAFGSFFAGALLLQLRGTASPAEVNWWAVIVEALFIAGVATGVIHLPTPQYTKGVDDKP